MRHRISKGSALIVTLAILMILSSMGIFFVKATHIENQTGVNFVNTVNARLTALAGIERTYQEIYNQAFRVSFNTPQDSWFMTARGANDTYDEPITGLGPDANYHLHFPIPGGAPAASGFVGDNGDTGNYENFGNRYYVKVLDAASQININAKASYLRRILINLGERLEYWSDPAQDHRIISQIKPFVDNGPFNPLSADQADSIEEYAFGSKAELKYLVGETNYQVLKDFVTIHSWQDPHSSKVSQPPQSVDEIAIYGAGNKAPININTASRPVLEALIMGLEAQVPMFHWYNGTGEYDEANPGEGLNFDEVTELHYQMELVTVQGFTASIAEKIVEKILARRWNTPFKNWDDFYTFVDNLDPSTELPLTTFKPSWISDQTWYQLCRDLLKSNFDPNVHETRFNFNTPVCLTVAKGDITQGSPEFCFSSMGHFEITVVGEVRQNSETVSQHQIRAVVQLYNTIRHTNQQQFEGADADFYSSNGSTISYPENIPDITRAGGDAEAYANEYMGWIEPKPEDYSFVNSNYLFDQNGNAVPNPIFKADFDPNTPNTTNGMDADPSITGGSLKYRSNPSWVDAVNRINQNLGLARTTVSSDYLHSTPQGLVGGFFGVNSKLNSDLMPDGLLSHYIRARYLLYQAAPDSAALSTPVLNRGINYGSGFNIPYYRGTIEFWVKLAIDSTEHIPCGMIGVTQVHSNPTTIRTPGYKEGVQMYIYKTPLNELRVSRIYFGRHYYDPDPYDSDPPDSGGIYKAADGDKDGSDTDSLPRFRFCHKEYVQPLPETWKAHEWHHVVVSWDDRPDSTYRLGIDCWIDGQCYKSDTGDSPASPPLYVHPENPDGNNHIRPNDLTPFTPRFVTGNILNPADVLYIGGFVRFQVSPDGLFKFATTTMMPLNGTIDSIRIYRGPLKESNGNIPNDAVLGPQERYNSTRDAYYHNAITLPANKRLGCVYWTVRHPTGVRSTVYDASTRPQVSLACKISNTTPVGTLPWSGTGVFNAADGVSELLFPTNTNSGTGNKLYYQVRFQPPSGDYLVPAAFDDITVTYQERKILAWEEQ